MNYQQEKSNKICWIKDKENQNIGLFALLVIVLSGLLLLLHFVFTEVGNYDVSFTQYAPMLALILLLIIRRDKAMLKGVKEKLKISWKSILYSFIVFVALIGIFVAVNYILLAALKPFEKWKTPSLFLSLLFMMFGCIAEEVGWLGYLLPALNQKISLLLSSVMVGIFWGVWHLNFSEGIAGFLSYTLFITSLSVIMSWVQFKNENKLFPAIIFHFVINLFCRMFLFNRIGWQAYLILSGFFIIIAIVLFTIDKKTFLSRLECRRP